MKVILTKNVAGLGKAGDIKEVSDGHARNFLIPQHLALPATSSLLQKVQKEELEHQAKVKKEQELFEQLKHKIENKTFIIKAKADKHHLFASVKEQDIIKAITDEYPIQLTPSQILIEKNIKTLGEHEVSISLAGNQALKVKLIVEAL